LRLSERSVNASKLATRKKLQQRKLKERKQHPPRKKTKREPLKEATSHSPPVVTVSKKTTHLKSSCQSLKITSIQTLLDSSHITRPLDLLRSSALTPTKKAISVQMMRKLN